MPNYKNQACPRSIQKESNLRAKKKSLFDAAAKIGKLEFLNDFGLAGGTARKGLEQLAVVSDTIRVGNYTSDTSTGILADDGSGLMSEMGMDSAFQTAVSTFDPNAVNGAVGASKALVAKAKQGNFRMEDIAVYAGEFKNIALIGNKIFKAGAESTPSENYQKFKCRPSPYAMDLVHKAPKQNFQFVVEIILNPAYQQQFLLSQSDTSNNFIKAREEILVDNEKTLAFTPSVPNSELAVQVAFLVKNSARPSVTYEYEDLNYYNYRTKGIRKATFNPVAMEFTDDQLNSMAAFYAFYTSAMSPIINMGSDPVIATGLRNMYEQGGMNYSDFTAKQSASNARPNTNPAYAASIGALRPSAIGESNTTRQIIDRITIYQFGKNANTMTAFNMFSPRILSFAPSNVTYAESGEGQTLAMELDYDFFTIQPEIQIYGGAAEGQGTYSDKVADLSGGDAGAFFPIKHFPAETTNGAAVPALDSFVSVAGSRLGTFLSRDNE